MRKIPMLMYIENFIVWCLYCTGIVRLALWFRQRAGRSLVILNYHRASGGYLREHLLYLRRQYHILPLETALEELFMPSQEEKQSDHRLPLVLTFDDGNRDNYTNGFHLARELQVPLTLFLLPGYIESGRRFWWDEPEYLISHAQKRVVTISGQTYHLDNREERETLWQFLDTQFRHAPSIAVREEFLEQVRGVLAVPDGFTPEEEATIPITWAQVQEMEKSGWVSFGAHSMHHPILADLSNPSEVTYEIEKCRLALEQQLGHAVRTFAYPVGNVEHIGAHALSAVQKAGYWWALTTMYGSNTPQTNPFLLRRVIVDVDQHWLAVAVKAAGVWSFFTHLHQIAGRLLRMVHSILPQRTKQP